MVTDWTHFLIIALWEGVGVMFFRANIMLLQGVLLINFQASIQQLSAAWQIAYWPKQLWPLVIIPMLKKGMTEHLFYLILLLLLFFLLAPIQWCLSLRAVFSLMVIVDFI
jgi:hypothetical protein